MQIVISEHRVDGEFMVSPEGGFRVPDLPVFGIFSGIDDVATDGNEGRVFLIDSRNQGLANGRVSGFRVSRVMEARVSKRNEAKRRRHLLIEDDMIHSAGK